MPVDRRLLAIAIGTRLTTVTNAVGYYGTIGRPLPGQSLIENGGTIPANPPVKDSLQVKPYFILWPGAGAPFTAEADLGDTHDDLVDNLQVTAAAGDADDLLALVNRLHAVLFRWAPTVPGVVCGPLRYPPGWNPGPLRVDHDFAPVRLFVPLQYQLVATT